MVYLKKFFKNDAGFFLLLAMFIFSLVAMPRAGLAQTFRGGDNYCDAQHGETCSNSPADCFDSTITGCTEATACRTTEGDDCVTGDTDGACNTCNVCDQTSASRGSEGGCTQGACVAAAAITTCDIETEDGCCPTGCTTATDLDCLNADVCLEGSGEPTGQGTRGNCGGFTGCSLNKMPIKTGVYGGLSLFVTLLGLGFYFRLRRQS